MTDTETDRYDAMRAELKTAEAMRPGEPRNDRIRLTTASALVDIAESLGTLSLESMLAMQTSGALERIPDEGVDGGPERGGEGDPGTPLDVGDRVITSTILGYPRLRGTLLEGSGVSEGDAWVNVAWDDGSDGTKVWLKGIERDDPTTVLDQPADPDVVIEPDHEPDPRDQVDDIDADFDGDTHVAAVSGIAALKALEGKGGKSGKGKSKGKN